MDGWRVREVRRIARRVARRRHLVQRVADDLNVGVVLDVVHIDALAKILPERRVYQDGVEELLRVLNVDDRLHLGEDAERVALLEQIGELAVLPPPQQHQRLSLIHI